MVTGCRVPNGAVKQMLQDEHGISVPDWKIRRTIDQLERDGRITVQRAVNSRMIEVDDIQVIADELRQTKWHGCDEEE